MIAARSTPPPRRVLIIKPSALGDVVTAMPVLRGLRRTFPHARIEWLVNRNFAPLIAHDADLDACMLFDRGKLGAAWRSPASARAAWRLLGDLRKGAFDWVLDLQGLLRSGLFAAATRAPVRAGFAGAREGAAVFYNRRVRTSAAHTVDRNIELARSLGVDARAEDMTLQVSQDGKEFAEDFLQTNALSPGTYLVCVPPTRWPTKRYPPRHWRRVISAFAGRITVVLLGGPGDRDVCAAAAENVGGRLINLAGETGIEQFVAVLASSGGVVCCDSAAGTIASATGVGVVMLTGPTRPQRTGPYRCGTVVAADVPCRGCLKRRCSHVTCMELIDPDRVTAATEKMLENRRAPACSQ